ncbi:MAG: type II secretion system F family protein [Bacteroidota bacterium]
MKVISSNKNSKQEHVISNENEVSWQQKITKALSKEIRLGGNQLKDRKKLNFYNDLKTLLSSGIDIKSCLDLIVEEYTKKEEKHLFTQVKNTVISGTPLSEALGQTKRFSNYEIFSIKIGEETGRLNQVLDDIISYYNRKIEQKRKLVNALTYPVIVLTTALLAVFFMLRYIVPMFEDVFKRFNNRELPALTSFIIKCSNFIGAHAVHMLLIVVIIIAFIILFKKRIWYRKAATSLTLRLPFFGELIRKMYLSRFCLSMELLTGASVPLMNAIQLLRKMIGFYPMETSLEIIEKDLLNGKSLHQSMSHFSIYDKRMISLIKVAEEVNQLNMIFGKLKQQYTADVEYKTNSMSSILEPLIIILVGLFVGVILIAMYLPMFQLSSVVSG